jgi:hypothetical protein
MVIAHDPEEYKTRPVTIPTTGSLMKRQVAGKLELFEK